MRSVIAGLRHIGTKVGYSNVSSTAAAVSIAIFAISEIAPGNIAINRGAHRSLAATPLPWLRRAR